MSALERNTSRKGQKQRPKVEATTILEALYDMGGSVRPATIMEVAIGAGVSRNTASDRLLELWNDIALVVKRRKVEESAGGPRPWVYTITQNGINAVLQLRAKRERLSAEADSGQSVDDWIAQKSGPAWNRRERVERAIEILEADAAAIEAKLAGGAGTDPRQMSIPGGGVAVTAVPDPFPRRPTPRCATSIAEAVAGG